MRRDATSLHRRSARWLPALVLALPAVTLATLGLTGTVPRASAETTATAVQTEGEIVIAAAGDIANCSHDRDEATAQLLDSIAPDRVLALGDNAYTSGTDAQFAGCYHPTWGRHKEKTHPTPGNHEYQTGGATGYFNYFGAAAGDPTKGYYAFDLGAWRFYSLNSNCSAVPCAAGSAQEQWLRADLAENPRTCTAVFMHYPRFASGESGIRRNNPSLGALYQAFYEASGDLWLVGHNHQYERLARLSPTGAIDPQGVRNIVAGTGGAALYVFGPPNTGSEVRSATHGVLKLTLRDDGYDWAFVPIAGSTFTDSGTDLCGADPSPGNAAPVVTAGPDRTVALSSGATLDGAVSDDGQPTPPALTTTWSQVSGPGPVTFGDATAVDTTAGFTQAGTYVLRLTADDGALSSFDDVTITVTDAGPPGPGFYFSLRAAGTVSGVSAANEDIVFYDGESSLVFDGSDVGLGSFRIDAFSRLDANTFLFSFDAPGSVSGISGTVDDSDIVRFEAASLGADTAGTFFLYFDGSDVGLTADAHDVDALEILPDARIILSTAGSATLSGIPARDEDLLAFAPSSLGDVTAGSFSMYFDGRDVWLGENPEDVDAVAIDPSGSIYLSALETFAVPDLSGADEDVFVFAPTSTGSTTAGSYAQPLFFDGSGFGLAANNVFAIDLP